MPLRWLKTTSSEEAVAIVRIVSRLRDAAPVAAVEIIRKSKKRVLAQRGEVPENLIDMLRND